jgi:hypothetical protein
MKPKQEEIAFSEFLLLLVNHKGKKLRKLSL